MVFCKALPQQRAPLIGNPAHPVISDSSQSTVRGLKSLRPLDQPES